MGVPIYVNGRISRPYDYQKEGPYSWSIYRTLHAERYPHNLPKNTRDGTHGTFDDPRARTRGEYVTHMTLHGDLQCISCGEPIADTGSVMCHGCFHSLERYLRGEVGEAWRRHFDWLLSSGLTREAPRWLQRLSREADLDMAAVGVDTE